MNTIPYRYRINTLSIYRDRDSDQDKTRLRVKHIPERGEFERGDVALEEKNSMVSAVPPHQTHWDGGGETLQHPKSTTGCVIGKRCGTSQNIGPKARKEHNG